MSEFAKNVARELDRRQRGRRLRVLTLLLALAIAAAMYLRCGTGFGLGGEGAGSGGPAAKLDAPPRRCQIKLAASGLVVNGKPGTRDDVLAACKPATGADLIVTGDAREGDVRDLREALDAAHIAVYVRAPR